MKALFILLVVSLTACGVNDSATVSEQYYEVEVLAKHGTSCNFYFEYSMDDKNLCDQSRIDQVHIRIDEELIKIADEYAMMHLINAIDSIGPRIENEMKAEFDLTNLSVLEIGVAKSIKDLLIEKEINVDRVKAVNPDEIINYAGSTKFKLEVKSTARDLSLVLKTKYDSEVLIEYLIHFRSKNNPIESLDQDIKNAIVDSLRQYDIYDMWALKRSSMQLVMEEIIKINYPDTYEVIILDVSIPEEAEKLFKETEQSRQDIMNATYEIMDSRKLLDQKLETDENLSESEMIEIKKEIQALDDKLKSVRKKDALITNDYEL